MGWFGLCWSGLAGLGTENRFSREQGGLERREESRESAAGGVAWDDGSVV